MTDGRTAIVTGAGSGVGRATARELAARGYRLLLAGRDAAKLAAVLAELPPPAEHLAAAVDLATAAGAAALAQRARAAWPRVDALVNAAGLAERHAIAATDLAVLRRHFAVNVEGPALLIAALWPMLLAGGEATIVNVSSLAAHDPFPGFFAYGAAKAALESLARSIANEAPAGIRPFNVALGAVETPMLRALFTEAELPPTRALAPAAVAALIVGLVTGERPARRGETVMVPGP